MGERLERAPLLEALCEFRFTTSGTWSEDTPEVIAARLGGEFPTRSVVSSFPLPPTLPPFALHRFTRQPPDAMLQVAPQILSVNQLRPYESWEAFRALVLRLLSVRNDVVGALPVARIGLRYINRIALDEGMRLRDVLTVRPDYILNRQVRGFYQRYDFADPSSPLEEFILQTGTTQGEDGRAALMLDLDAGTNVPRASDDIGAITTWLDQAHDHIEAEFIGCLTPEYFAGLKRGHS